MVSPWPFIPTQQHQQLSEGLRLAVVEEPLLVADTIVCVLCSNHTVLFSPYNLCQLHISLFIRLTILLLQSSVASWESLPGLTNASAVVALFPLMPVCPG